MAIDWSLVQYFFVTAIAAFAGASTAFLWERYQKKNDEKIKDLSAGNWAIFLLQQQYSVLNMINKQLIGTYRNAPGSWVNIPAALPMIHDDLHHNIASLQFLLKSKNPNLLSELLLEEQRFFEAIKTLNERSKLHRQELQPKLDILKIQQDQYVLTSEFESALGPVVVGGLKTLTSALIEHTDEGMDGIKKIYNEMRSQLEKMFPGKKIIKLEFKEADRP